MRNITKYLEAQRKATKKYNLKTYDRIEINVYKGEKDVIKKRAEQLGKSVNKYITDMIREDLKNEVKEKET